jgi:hypothetical protein
MLTRKRPSPRHIARRLLLPQYNELNLFLIGLSLLIVLATSAQVRHALVDLARFGVDFWMYTIPLALILLAGAAFAIIRAFTENSREAGWWWAMVLFANAANLLAAFAALRTRGDMSSPALYLFPGWTGLNATLLIVYFIFRGKLGRIITKADATPLQVALGLLSLVALFLFCHAGPALPGAITLAICLLFATHLAPLLIWASPSGRPIGRL